jgi:hypothetical protein
MNVRKKLVKYYIWSIAFHGAENCIDHKQFESLDRCWWRRMEKISWTTYGKNEEELHKVKEERNFIQTINKGRLTGLVTSCTGTAI